MKRLYNYIPFFLFLLGMISCNDDKEMLTVSGFQNGDAATLVASQSAITLSGETPTVSALTLTWGDYDLSLSSDAYQLPDGMIDKYIELATQSSFEGAESSLSTVNTRSYTHVELNNLTKKLGMEAWKDAPLYIRIKYVLGNNIAPQYSNVASVSITPYGIRMNSMDVLSADQERVTANLYSPTENGIYQGFIGASGWMNAYFRENDGTTWGNDGIVGTPFKLSNDVATHWNIWYPGVAGCYLTTVDTHTQQWSATLLTNLVVTVEGEQIEMKYSVPRNTWTGSFQTKGAASLTTGKAETKSYSIATDTNDDNAVAGLLDVAFSASVSKAGSYILTLEMGGEEVVATLEEGEIEESNYQNYLDMVNPDNWDDVKCRLYSPEENYIYQGFYYATGWENFKFATEDRETIYGSIAESLYQLDSTGSAWNIWMDTSDNGFYLYTANLSDGIWSYQEITSRAVSGDFNGWSITSDLMEYDVEQKVWKATLDISYIEWGMNIVINEDWEMMLTKKNDGVLHYGKGNNIVPTETGLYLLTINMWDMNNITYTLEKQ